MVFSLTSFTAEVILPTQPPTHTETVQCTMTHKLLAAKQESVDVANVLRTYYDVVDFWL